MKRVLIGVLALIVIAIAGFFGVNWYANERANREVEAAFAQIRATGAKADHGKVAFDPWTRTLTIADIHSETANTPPVSVKIGSVVAKGISQPDAGRISATSIETNDLDVEAQAKAPSTFHMTYKAPKIVVTDYTGPSRGEQPPADGSPLAISAFLLKQFATVSAASVSVPNVSGAFDLGNVAIGRGDFTYTGLVLDGIKDGRIASEKVSDVQFKLDAQQAGQAQTMTGHIVNIASADIDTTAIAAVLDPQGAPDDQVRRFYRQASIGPYDLTTSLGVQMHIDGLTVDEAGLRPSKLHLQALLALLARPPTTPPTPAQARDLAAEVADLWEGIVVKNEDVRGMSIKTPQGTIKLAGTHADMHDGKIDMALEGLDAQTPQGPLKVGRFALKAFDMAGIMRTGAQFADPAHKPSALQAMELLKALQGAELKDVVAPYKTTNKQVKIDNVSLDWGQFVGPIPTRAHFAARMNSPLDASNPALLPLLAAGIDTAAIDADLGAGWSETTATFALSPVKLDIANIASASATVSLAHVPREVFTIDPQAAMVQALQIEAGGLQLTLRDLGGVDLLIAQFARMQNLSRDDARQAILATIKASGDKLGSSNPDVAGVVDALSRFVTTPHQTLTLKLTPRAKVSAMQLVQLLSSDPPTALAEFKIEASTGL